MPTANLYEITPVELVPLYKPELSHSLPAKFKASVDIALGTLLGEYTSDPGVYGAYDHAGADGLNVLKGITKRRVVTDATGLITNLGGPLLSQALSEDIYASGYFACGDVANPTELDDAIAAGYARIVVGTATVGEFAIGL